MEQEVREVQEPGRRDIGQRPDAGTDTDAAPARRVSVPIDADVYGYVTERVTVVDAEASSHWDRALWNRAP